MKKNATLADVYPSEQPKESDNVSSQNIFKQNDDRIKLYDVVYASIATGDKNE